MTQVQGHNNDQSCEAGYENQSSRGKHTQSPIILSGGSVCPHTSDNPHTLFDQIIAPIPISAILPSLGPQFL